MKSILLFVFGLAAVFGDDSLVLKEFAEGNVEYVGNLYKSLLIPHTANFLACPLSIQSVFALVNGGAKGNTAKQITSTLHLPEGEEKTKETFLRLVESLQVNDKYTLRSANKVYVSDGFQISDHYKTVAVETFKSEIQNIDFSKTGQAIAEINKWVESKTEEKIKNLLAPDAVDASTVAVLINALYFQGKWVTKFSEVLTRPFNLNSKEIVNANFMNVESKFNYYECPELKAQFLELPYEGGEIFMTIVVPRDYEGLSALESNITNVLALPRELYDRVTIEVFIPKFKIETTTHLIPVLQSMGITDAFTGAADFTGIGANEDPLVISQVIQKAFIEVDEKGTTAAAATAITVGRMAKQQDLVFEANRPFLFYLRHKVNGILFIGRHSVAAKAE